MPTLVPPHSPVSLERGTPFTCEPSAVPSEVTSLPTSVPTLTAATHGLPTSSKGPAMTSGRSCSRCSPSGENARGNSPESGLRLSCPIMATLAASGDRKTPTRTFFWRTARWGPWISLCAPQSLGFPIWRAGLQSPGLGDRDLQERGREGSCSFDTGLDETPTPTPPRGRLLTTRTHAWASTPVQSGAAASPGNTDHGITRRPDHSASGVPPQQRKQLRDERTAALTAARRGAAHPSTDVDKRSVVRPQRPVTRP